jgi:ribosomal protein S30
MLSSIYNNVIGPNIDTAQQSLYYPRIKSTGFTCQPQGQQDFKPSFMTFLLGVDAAFSSILYWPTTRFRILQIAMTIGNGLTLSHSQQLFANAVLERVRSRHQYKGTIIQSAHQRACFEEYWTRAGQPLIPSAEQWNQVEKLRNSQEELHSVRIMSGQVSAELSAAYDLFVPLVSFDKTYGFSGITSSTPAFATTGRSQRPAIGMQPMPQEQFDVVLMEFESNAENALLVLQNGLDQLNLAREVEQLQVMP